MGQVVGGGGGGDTWAFDIISSKYYFVGKFLMNGRHNKVDRCKRVTINTFNSNANQSAHNV